MDTESVLAISRVFIVVVFYFLLISFFSFGPRHTVQQVLYN